MPGDRRPDRRRGRGAGAGGGAGTGRAGHRATLCRAGPRYDDVIVDVAAGDSPDLEEVLRVANCMLTPVQPAGLDVWTLGLLDDRVAEAHRVNPTLIAFGVLNRASANPRDRDTHDAQEAMAACVHLQIAAVVIGVCVAMERKPGTRNFECCNSNQACYAIS